MLYPGVHAFFFSLKLAMLVIFAVKSTAVSVASNNSLKFAAESSVLVLDSVAARFEEIDPGHIHNFNDQSANCKKKKETL